VTPQAWHRQPAYLLHRLAHSGTSTFVKKAIKKQHPFSLLFTATEKRNSWGTSAPGWVRCADVDFLVWSPGQSGPFHGQWCLSFVSGFPQRRYFGLSARSVPSTRPRICVCVVVRILRALATAQSLERRLVSDVALVPAVHFASAEARTDAMESPCVR